MDNEDKTVSYVHQAIMLGWSRAQVDAWAIIQEPPLTASAIDRAYAICVERWISAAATPDGELYALHVARREDIYRRAMASGDLGLGHKVLMDLAKLQQQYHTEQRRAAQKEQTADLVEQIKAKRAARGLRAVP